MTRRRAFASTLVAFLAIIFVSALVALLASQSWLDRATFSSFESRKVANHFSNSVQFLNDSARDAVFDSVYAGGNGDDALVPQYLFYAAQELNSSGVETSFSNLDVQSEVIVPPADGFENAYSVSATLNVFIRRGSAFKNESVVFVHRIDANITASPKRFRIDGLNVSVTP